MKHLVCKVIRKVTIPFEDKTLEVTLASSNGMIGMLPLFDTIEQAREYNKKQKVQCPIIACDIEDV